MKALQRLRRACERAKRSLSSSDSAFVEIEEFFEGVDLSETVTRAQFEEMNANLFSKTMVLVGNVLKDAGIEPSGVDEFVPVGGSSRIPKVQAMLKDFFGGKEPCKSVSPDHAIAYGAAVQAAIIVGSDTSDRLSKVLLMDVAPLTLGLATAGGIMTPLISRNTTIPVKATKKFSTNVDNQTSVMVQVYEGERAMVRDCSLLGRFTLEDIPSKPRGHPRIKVTYSIDANGILNVTAEEKSTSKVTKITITNDKGRLSGEEIQRMCDSAREFEEKDKEAKELAYAKVELENFINTAASILATAEPDAADRDGGSSMDGEDTDDDSLPDVDGGDDDAPPLLDADDDDAPPPLDADDDDAPPPLDADDDDAPPPLDADAGPPKPPATQKSAAAPLPAADGSDDDSLPQLDDDGGEDAVVIEDGGSGDDSLPDLDDSGKFGSKDKRGGKKVDDAQFGMTAKVAMEQIGTIVKNTREWLSRDRVYKDASAEDYKQRLASLKSSLSPLLSTIQTKEQIKRRQFSSPDIDGDSDDDKPPSRGGRRGNDDGEESDGSMPDLNADEDEGDMPPLDADDDDELLPLDDEPGESEGLEELD